MAYKTLNGVGTTFIYKDGFGAGNSSTENVVPNNVVNDKETYIGGKGNKKVTMNRINHTKVGDDIHYYQNGIEGRGIVVKMSNEYVMVAKDDGDFEDIHINDTFFVKDIVLNKTWDMMDSSERGEVLEKAHAPSARFITKDWHNLPVELREVLTKFTGSTSEAGISRDDETKTHRDQDQSLAANNSTTDDEQADGLKRDEKNASDIGKVYEGADINTGKIQDTSNMRIGTKKKKKKPKKCVSCGKVHKGDWKEKDSLTETQSSDRLPLDDPSACEICGQEGGHGNDEMYHSELMHSGLRTGRRGTSFAGGEFTPDKIRDRSPANIKRSDVEHGAYGAISTDTPLDVSDDTGYEERPHLCAECVGNLPREDAKDHHDNEIEDKKSPAKVKEPHVVEGETSHPKDKSEQFRKIYGGGKKKLKKGVPEWNVNSWGINYTVNEDEG